ncbi:glycerol-3-phosphate dehydrogenase subunit C [Desulfacinum infernum DSM 9756]|uniref:Glycerol-3-phosphate dehydrogenase subunit C n=1 Tax=Desulfacinum infernum DSM 9756 TaxID=1121391 RepID=A0A1M4TYE8_9BACT|nr:heterodisulfide reductase-related iron-sulfur binding cluster [Desulfacinum infernum]SHE49521.1 glycerol-3-phosphate dehydrogenase subunit C [Desulfacinum infernum DSM 9756]
MKPGKPEEYVRRMVSGCTDCDICRFLMDECCLVFPRIFELHDREQEGGPPVEDRELLELTDLCTLCGLCPCPDVRANLLRAKAERVRRDGLSPDARLLSDLQSVGTLPALLRRAASFLLKRRTCSAAVARLFGLQPDRRLPLPAKEDFFAWADRRGLRKESRGGRKAAYFVGCTAAYLFPEVARAAVAVLERCGVSVYVPEQQCCGMPTAVEGDEKRTLERVRANLDTLLRLSDAGYDLVCSCPTCGYFLRVILKENACLATGCGGSGRRARSDAAPALTQVLPLPMPPRTYGPSWLADDFFPSLDPEKRIELADRIHDLGEYVRGLAQVDSRILPKRGPGGRWVYFEPCHQREQENGGSYLEILSRISGFQVVRVGSSTDCCGMGGSLGFKREFHEISLQLGGRLFEKIRTLEPDGIVTDCLSCRLQFRHNLPYAVVHPLEILAGSTPLAPQGRDG